MFRLRFDPTFIRHLRNASLLGAFAFALLPSLAIARSDEPTAKTDAPPKGLSATDWSSIRAAYEANRHAAFAVDGGWQARNPEQQWTTKFDGRGFEAKPDQGDWSWGLELQRYGFAGAERVVTKPESVNATGPRVAYAWDATIEEWYVNDTRGLEHGFTVRERPAAGVGALTITLAVRGGLTPDVSSDGGAVQFTNAAGATVLNYAGLIVRDANGKALIARFDRTGAELVLSIEESGARYPLTIDPIAQQAYLKASNAEAGDNFGAAASVSGDTVVIGAPSETSNATGVNGNQSDNSLLDAGAAYVFVRNGTNWTQQAYLKASNTDVLDNFGHSVSISGETLVVGAFTESSNAKGINGNQSDNSAGYSGAVYVFVRSGATWSQQAYLKASNTEAGDLFGTAVSVSGDAVVVGASGEDSIATGVNGDQSDNTAADSGAAYVFVRNGATWSQQAYVKASNTGASDFFGGAVSVSGDLLVIGAIEEDCTSTGINGIQFNNNAPGAGAAYVFARNGTVWTQQAYLKASNTGVFDHFGVSVSVASETIVVGAKDEDSNAVGVNGDQSTNNANAAGAAYVFVRTGTTWAQQAYLKASNTEAGDAFGGSVSVSGDAILVGAVGEDSSASGVNGNQNDNSASTAGAAYLFVRSGVTWAQTAYLKASNAGVVDRFGESASISDDNAVIGANGEASSSTGVNGNQTDNSAAFAGAAYVFDLTAWLDLGSGLAGGSGIPKLVGTGSLQVGSSGATTLTNAAPNRPAILVSSLSTTPMSFFCGTLLPSIGPTYAVVFPTDATGGVNLTWSSWPAGLSGQSLYTQWIVSDPAAVCTVALSNAVRGDVP